MPRYTKPRRTWQYTNEFKVKAVQLSLDDQITSKSVADALDIHSFMLSRWRKEYREGRFVVKKTKTKAVKAASSELSRLKKLEAENERLKKENDLLKKWQRFLAVQHQNDIDSSKSTPET
jgi:transposase